MQFLSLIVLFGSLVANADVGFKNGNELTAVLAEGNIVVQCSGVDNNGGPTMATYNCREELLLPSEFDYFKGPRGVAADKVVLSARHEDGSERLKSEGYDSSKGQSAKRFNLWVATLLQKPLLDGGSNVVSYSLTSKGKLVARGEFLATVVDGGRKYCPRQGYYWSDNGMDCRSGSNLCARFFQENNYCL